MANLTVKGIPDELHAQIKRRAGENHRSMNREILQILEEAMERAPQTRPDAEEILQRLRTFRGKMHGPGLTPEEIDRAIDEGRP
jgi:plasmid stability protein